VLGVPALVSPQIDYLPRRQGCRGMGKPPGPAYRIEHGPAPGKAELGKPTLYERGKGAAYFVAAAVAALGTLYLLGLWVDH
jgi:hypothetical protein